MDAPLPSDPGGGILVVDDTLATLQILNSILTAAGYRVRTATDGSLALRSAQSQPPDLILLDVRMSDPDGFEVCRRLKADERTRSIPVIFTTALDEARDRLLGFQLGAVDYITKPFDIQEVLARISTHLAFRRTQQELQQANQQLMAEIAVRERAEATLREILENAFGAAYRRNLQSNVYDYLGPAFTRISGYMPEETLTVPVEVVLDRIHPEDQPAVAQAIAACLAHPGEPAQVDFRYRHRAGHYLWLQDRFTVVPDARGQPARLVGNVHDITERKQAEAALHDLNESLERRIAERTAQLEESNRELRIEIAARQQAESALRQANAYNRSLIEAGLDPLVTIGPDGKVTDVNCASETITGRSREQLIGTDFSDYFTDPDRARAGYQQVFREGAVRDFALEVRHISGQMTPVLYNATVYRDEAGETLGVFAAARDITVQKQAEAALRASEARYRELAEENARLLGQSRKDAETKAILLHEVNHRVKNNLAAIIGLLQLELRYLRGEEQTPYRLLVQDLTGRIQSLALVHNLLSARLWAPLPLAKLAENVMQIAPVMLSPRQAVQLDIAPTAVDLTPKQATAVGLILNELTTNSLKHALRSDEPVCLSLQASQTGDEVHLEYRDNGPGYPAEVLQGERQTVGLYLIEALAEHDLGGEITFSNDRGGVARLRFAQTPDAEPAGPQVTIPAIGDSLEAAPR
jgi:PAS domain S-box-containing protein